MTFSEFLNTSFIENDGATEDGRWLPKHIAALQEGLRQLLQINGHTDVDSSVGGTAVYDYVLFKAANSNTWTVKKASEIKPTVDTNPTQGSNNPVSSDGVYIALHQVIETIEALENKIERVIDGGNARTISMNLAARRIDCGRAIDKV